MSNITFANPGYFYLLLLIIPILGAYFWKQRHGSASIQLSSLGGFAKAPKSYKQYFRHILVVLRVLLVAVLVAILARPQTSNNWQNETTEGIDIVLALDLSSSMLACDFQPNRIEAAKNVAVEFVSGRPNDRIGLVVFSGESFTQCPITGDHAVLINLVRELKSGMIDDGTAIGMGLGTAVNRLKESTAKSKVIILLTDGVNNMGSLAPETAAEIAQTFGIRVYTVGIGTMGYAKYPVPNMFGGMTFQDMKVEIDEQMLRKIADKTNGKYFRATGNKKLKQVYQEIDKLEKSKISIQHVNNKKEEYFFLAVFAALLLLLELLLRNTLFRSLP